MGDVIFVDVVCARPSPDMFRVGDAFSNALATSQEKKPAQMDQSPFFSCLFRLGGVLNRGEPNTDCYFQVLI